MVRRITIFVQVALPALIFLLPPLGSGSWKLLCEHWCSRADHDRI